MKDSENEKGPSEKLKTISFRSRVRKILAVIALKSGNTTVN